MEQYMIWRVLQTLILKRCLWINTETVLRAISQLNLRTISLAGTGSRIDVTRVLHVLATRPLISLDCADWPLLTVLELRDIARYDIYLFVVSYSD